MAAITHARRLFPNLEEMADESERSLAELEPAWAKAALFFRTGHRLGHGPDSMRCMSLVEINRLLGVYRQRFERGETMAALHAVAVCAEENLPMPEWLARAFKRQFDLFLRPGVVSSLDEVFRASNLPTRARKRAAAVRTDWQLGGKLLVDAFEVLREDETLLSFDAVIDRVLARKNYGIAKTKVRSLIRQVEVNQTELLGHDTSLAGVLAKRRREARIRASLVFANPGRTAKDGDTDRSGS